MSQERRKINERETLSTTPGHLQRTVKPRSVQAQEKAPKLKARLANMARAQDEAMTRQMDEMRRVMAAERVALTRAIRDILQLVQESSVEEDGLQNNLSGMYSCLQLAGGDSDPEINGSESLPDSENDSGAVCSFFEEHFAYQQDRLQAQSATQDNSLPSAGIVQQSHTH